MCLLVTSTHTFAPSAMPTHAISTQSVDSFLSSLLSFLLSFSALSDWLKLLVIGGLLETFRRLSLSVWKSFINSFWITIEFEQEDASFDWMMIWLAQQPTWTRAREISISTRSYQYQYKSHTAVVPGEPNPLKDSKKIAYLPSFNSTHTLWYKHHYLRISRTKIANGVYRTTETLKMQILTRDHQIVSVLLLEAKEIWNQAQEHHISIFTSNASNRWQQLASRPKRPLQSIVLDDGIKELLLDDARDFLDSRRWYSERGIPFRRGYLLHGVPGSGKTSIIHGLAGELGLNVYVISLSRSGLDDSSLQQLIADLPERCIALIEDIDAAFHQNINRGIAQEGDDDSAPTSSTGSPTPTSRISMSGVLNALDSLSAQEGRLLFSTTNRYSALDAALCRPGRMDLHVEFKLASKYQASELFKCFYVPVVCFEDETYRGDDKENMDSETPSSPRSIELDDSSVAEDYPFIGTTHKLIMPKLTSKQVADLAQQFGDAIPAREFSMASLQGYLMSYKIRPFEAVAFVSKWVEKERKKRRGGSLDVELE